MASARSELENKSYEFAERIRDVLNRTICPYPPVGVSVDDEADAAAVVGTNIGRSVRSTPIELRTKARDPLWLDVSYRLVLEGEDRHLTVLSSFFGISVGSNEAEWFHYDYERDKNLGKEDGTQRYPEAHLQVHGRHPALEEFAESIGAKNRLGRYHLPVGGRRLRPCLEDVIEFLAFEGLVNPLPGWEEVIDRERYGYRRTQVKALVRRNFGTVIEALREHGYTVVDPDDPSKRAKIMRLIDPRTPTIFASQKKKKKKTTRKPKRA